MEMNDIYRELKWRFKEAGIPAYPLEARLLMQKFLGVTPETLLSGNAEGVTPAEAQRLWVAAEERMKHRPLQYILGEWEFYGRSYRVGDGVLIPRPDTEVLCDVTLPFLKERPAPRVVCDLCSGSGCVAVTLAEEGDAHAYAVEKFPEAYAYLEENCRSLSKRVTPVLDDAAAPVHWRSIPRCDLITANPPYLTGAEMDDLQPEVAFEPRDALYGGPDGLGFYRVLPRLWKQKLVQGGMLAMEVGAAQAEAVVRLLSEDGYRNIRAHSDLNHIPRVVTAVNG